MNRNILKVVFTTIAIGLSTLTFAEENIEKKPMDTVIGSQKPQISNERVALSFDQRHGRYSLINVISGEVIVDRSEIRFDQRAFSDTGRNNSFRTKFVQDDKFGAGRQLVVTPTKANDSELVVSFTLYEKHDFVDIAVSLKNLSDEMLRLKRIGVVDGDLMIPADCFENFRMPDGGGWVSIQNQQREVLALTKNTGMAVLNDIGNARNGHPKNKMDVGRRLMLLALNKAYGKEVVCSGPLYKSTQVQGSKVVVKFDHVGSGLMVGKKHLMEPAQKVDEPLNRFQICGADRQWKWAQARIVGKDKVEVWHQEVPAPVEVRYAWSSNPSGANLYNKEGLPASLFTAKVESNKLSKGAEKVEIKSLKKKPSVEKACDAPVIRLWPIEMVGGEQNRLKEEFRTNRRGIKQLCGIKDPNLTVFKADSRQPTPAVVYCPGGAYKILDPQPPLIQRLNAQGITVFMLKYTIPDHPDGAFKDIQRAMRLVRHQAKKWNIDPNQIGVVGNSAGSHLSARLTQNYDQTVYEPIDEADRESCEPNFAILQCAAYFQGLEMDKEFDAGLFHMKNRVAPTFLTYAKDDKFCKGGVEYARRLTDAGGSIELKLFEKGGHGMRGCDWFTPMTQWLKGQKVLK